MCGIAGIFAGASAGWSTESATKILRQMTDAQVHRGPDAEGVWLDERNRCHLGHRRLSIIDVSDAGRQPMVSTDGRRVIVFNGEIYNYLELRPQLAALGRDIRGRTDTEVLLEAIAAWGIDAFPKLDGMYALAVFDRDSGDLLLARDPFGEKPLYYTELPGGGLAFASELQALEKIPGLDRTVSIDAVGEYLKFQYINAPRTIYAKVKKLPPGHWLRASGTQPPQIGRHFSFVPRPESTAPRLIADLADELEEILVRSIRRRLIADVPLGAFLSGGVDSSTVCALIRKKIGSPLKTFSVGFEGFADSEHLMAREIAQHLGTEHHELMVETNIRHFLENTGALLDEPNGDSSCLPVYNLSQLTRKHVTVAVSGDGGDEMFLGYGRYFATIDEAASFGAAGEAERVGSNYLGRVLVMPDDPLRILYGEVPPHCAALATSLVDSIGTTPNELIRDLRRTDVETYLPGAVLAKVDRMSMQHSLEVRTPFLSVELARFCEKLPLSALYRRPFGKIVLREVMKRYLPPHIVEAPKRGFGVPVAGWAQSEVLALARERLTASESPLRRFFGDAAMDRFLAFHGNKQTFSYYQVWETLVLENWLAHRGLELPANRRRRKLWSGFRHRPARRQQEALYAWPVGGNCFVVFEDRDHDIFDIRRLAAALGRFEQGLTDGNYRLTPKSARLLEMLHRRDLLSDPELQRLDIGPDEWNSCIRLPFWRQTRGNSQDSDLRRLRDATLLFPHSPVWRATRRGEVRRFAKLGVAELVFWEDDHSSLVALQLNRQMRRTAPISLWSRRIASWTRPQASVNSVGMRQVDWRKHARRSGRKASTGRPVLFEGFNQLIPAPGGIGTAGFGPGRYRIDSQACEFLPRRNRWWPPAQYWMGSRDDDNAAALGFDVKLETSDDSEGGPIDQVARIFEKNTTASRKTFPNGGRNKVVLVTASLAPGGAERQWCYLARGLKKLGADVEFIVTDNIDGPNGHYLFLLREIGIEPFVLGQRWSLRTVEFNYRMRSLVHAGADNWFIGRVPELASLFVDLNPAAVFAQLDSSNLMAGIAGQLADVPRVVMSFRNYNPDNFDFANPAFQPLYRILSRSPRICMTANAKALCSDYARWIGTEAGRIVCVPNTINPAETRPATAEDVCRLRKEFDISESTRLIVGAFRLSLEKRPLVFIDVCAEIAATIANLRVLIAGIGPMQQEIEERIKRHRLEPVVQLIGRRLDVNVMLSTADLVLHTACLEGMPNLLMEAQTLGVPVVTTASGGVPDIVIDGRTGFVTDIDDVKSLARHCIAILQDRPLAKRLSLEASSRMKQFADIKGMAARYLEVAAVDIQQLDKAHLDPRGLVREVDEIFETNFTVARRGDGEGARSTIALVTTSLASGGSEHQWCHLARGLKQLGADVEFIILDNIDDAYGHYLPLLRSIGIQPIFLGEWKTTDLGILRDVNASLQSIMRAGDKTWFMERIPEFVSLLIQLKPAALIAQLDSVNLRAAIAGQLAGVPRIIMSFRSCNPDKYPNLADPKFRPLYQSASRSPRIHMTANANSSRLDYANWIGIDASRVRYIPNAVTAEEEARPAGASQLRRELGISDSTPLIAGVLRLSWEKSPLVFIDVCARVAAELPALRAIVAGDGPMRQEMEHRIRQHRLCDVITLLGRRLDVHAVLSGSDVVLNTSSIEGMPNVVMEAQMLGVPVVATAVGGTPDIVVSGSTGFMADVDDVEGLARGAIILLKDRTLARRLGQNAAEHMKQFADIETMARRYLKLAGIDRASCPEPVPAAVSTPRDTVARGHSSDRMGG